MPTRTFLIWQVIISLEMHCSPTQQKRTFLIWQVPMRTFLIWQVRFFWRIEPDVLYSGDISQARDTISADLRAARYATSADLRHDLGYISAISRL